MSGVSFRVARTIAGQLGRAGFLETPNGVIQTPAFVAVATQATVKALTPVQVRELGIQCVLANTYHLYLEPGQEFIRAAGGLSKYMNWKGPTMTDSGGFQVFSLGAAFGHHVSKVSKINSSPILHSQLPLSNRAQTYSNLLKNTRVYETADMDVKKSLAEVDEEGVTFKSHRDGSTHRFTPERSIEIQHAIGANIIFSFDECPSPESSAQYQREAMERTHRWAKRSLTHHQSLEKTRDKNSLPQAIFGIVQGGRFEELRKESAHTIGSMGLARSSFPSENLGGFDGFGIGGSFDKRDMGTAVRWVNEILPPEKPRHLLGIGEPTDLVIAIENGCDTFDCVAPTRMGRTGTLYTRTGRINITNSRFKTECMPIDTDCDCYTCRSFTRSYLHHLFAAHEMLGATLSSIHNLRFITRLVDDARESILQGTFQELKTKILSMYQGVS